MPNHGPLAQPKKAPRFVRALGRSFSRLFKDLFDSYHPERHYMRGPGPKWHEKHAAKA